MKKFILFLAAGLFLSMSGIAQTVLFEDDFEGFAAGDNISTAAEFWDTWSGNTGGSDDAQITDAFNNTVDGANSLELQEGQDIVGFFGDKTSGAYQVSFYYYVESGDGGYFNIEHVFGSEWAFSVNFDDGGTGTLNYNGTTEAITYPQDEWFPVVIDVSLDNDEVTIDLNNTEFTHTWTFSTQESGGSGQNILDCINFYGAANSGTANYYIDDFQFIETEAGFVPQEITVDITEVITDGSAAETVTITNEGQDPLTFEAYAYYPNPNIAKAEGNNTESAQQTSVTLVKNLDLSQAEIKELQKAMEYENDRDATLSYVDSEVMNSLGWANIVTMHAVALFDHEMVKPYIGMEVSNVIIFVGNAPAGTPSVEVWEGFDRTFNGPVDLISSEDFTAEAGTQSSVNLSEPAFVSGKDLWVGWTFTDPGADNYCLGMDDGPPTPDVNFIKSSAAWSAVNDAEYGDFGIVANLTGTAIPTWLSLDVTEGEITGGNSQAIQLSFDGTGLETGQHTCTMVIDNNDADESWYEIPVTLDYVASSGEEAAFGLMTFPNPVSETLNVVADKQISSIEIVSFSGKTVLNKKMNTDKANISLQALSNGVYFVNINIGGEKFTRKIVVE